MKEGWNQGERPELDGGGVIRSMGGVLEYWEKNVRGRAPMGDERILGDEDFVNDVLEEAEKTEERRSRLRRKGWNFRRVLDRAAKLEGLKTEDVLGNSKERGKSRARALVCKWMVDDLGYPTVKVARSLGLVQSAVTQSVARGRELERSRKIRLEGHERRRKIRIS